MVDYKCDICGRIAKANSTDITEMTEYNGFIKIRECGGYGSVFGDEEEINYDICQHCFYNFLKEKNALEG